jgi:hypothetical protein
MAIARCDKHTPSGTRHAGTKYAYKAFALPLGYPETAAKRRLRGPRALMAYRAGARRSSEWRADFRYPYQCRENPRVGRAYFKLRLYLCISRTPSERGATTSARVAAEDAWSCPTHEQGSLVLIPILRLSDLRLPNRDGR